MYTCVIWYVFISSINFILIKFKITLDFRRPVVVKVSGGIGNNICYYFISFYKFSIQNWILL